MTRIIAGTAGGRRLKTPAGGATRPTSDRVREALFSAIEAWNGSWEGLAVLDLYAGSGAIGLEAISRGAVRATLVEHDKRTADLIRDNARTLAMGSAKVHTATVATLLASDEVATYDVVFLDPPYTVSAAAVDRDLQRLAERGWVAPDGLVVIERPRRSPEPTWPLGWEQLRSKRYGDSVLWYGHADPEPHPEQHPNT